MFLVVASCSTLVRRPRSNHAKRSETQIYNEFDTILTERLYADVFWVPVPLHFTSVTGTLQLYMYSVSGMCIACAVIWCMRHSTAANEEARKIRRAPPNPNLKIETTCYKPETDG